LKLLTDEIKGSRLLSEPTIPAQRPEQNIKANFPSTKQIN